MEIDELLRIMEDVKYSNSIAIAASECNREAFSGLRGKYKGREVAVCGAGPSLNNYCPIEGAVHIALNRAILFDKVVFDYFFADDWLGINFIQDEIIKYSCEKYLGFHFGAGDKVIPEYFFDANNAHRYYTDSFAIKSGFHSRFATDIDLLPLGNMPNIAQQVLQVALFMHPSKIYLVGCDASKGHFVDADVSDTQRNTFETDTKQCVEIDGSREKWLELKRFAEIHYPDIQIISVNPVGLKGVFTDVYQ